MTVTSPFSYYGGKSKLAHLYPRPRYDRIIEPFAGSAAYAFRHWHDVSPNLAAFENGARRAVNQ